MKRQKTKKYYERKRQIQEAKRIYHKVLRIKRRLNAEETKSKPKKKYHRTKCI